MDEIFKWTNLQRVLGEVGADIRNAYQDNLIKDGKIATGNLLNSVNYQVQYDDRAIWVELHLEDYYKWVEEGRSPGKYPPMDSILEWIRVKPIIPDDRTGTLPTEKQLAFLISRKIAEQGIEAGHQLRDAMDSNMANWEEAIDTAISQDVAEGVDIIFSEFFK